ncbi:MAG: hypothetical protein L0Z50_43185, partial [Verrucomicrobiales bacterium]|nr:hypothetical protein [Verrucomicrobiales bacterium]
MRNTLSRATSLAILLARFASSAQGQTVTQQIPIKVGWNAIWLEVEPVNPEIGQVFNDPKIEAVWTYLDRKTPVQFIQNPGDLPVNNPGWRRFLTATAEATLGIDLATRQQLNNLFSAQGCFAYLIKSAGDFTLAITGGPCLRRLEWVPNSFNLRGFPIDPAQPPSFDDFFESADAHRNQPIYWLDPADGKWKRVQPTDLLSPGRAYWVYSEGASTFTAPFEIELEAGDGLAYASSLTEQAVTIRNPGHHTEEVSLEYLNPSDSKYLSYRRGTPGGQTDWQLLSDPTLAVVAPDSNETWRLAIRRDLMQQNGVDSYATVLLLRDYEGTRYLLPVTAARFTGATAEPAVGSANAATRPPRVALQASKSGASAGISYAGLWVGNATINGVSQRSKDLLARGVTTGGADAAKAQAVLYFTGANNDVRITAAAAGSTDNDFLIDVAPDTSLAEGGVSVTIGATLQIRFKPASATANALITALNAATTRFVAAAEEAGGGA